MKTPPVSDRPLGPRVPGWSPPVTPHGIRLIEGRYAVLEPLSADRHAASLFTAYSGHDHIWDYMPYGPFHSSAQYHRWVKDIVADASHVFLALRDRQARAYIGAAAFLRIKPQAGSIELGHICLAPSGQRSRAATEAFFLMMTWAFEAGYRRFEWKCDALNLPSRRAAQRLGLSYEGVFRQATVVKGRNRDTAWFAAIDTEWPALKAAFDSWLSPANFDAKGRQIERLSDLTRLVRAASDPAL
ncbi:GNAT family protein [Mesobacterium sp. TK19101]|uniref:GNAT family protein n=1 Tax=Mesobacterium hydrothermale TaxID=3111907 RepID=A0ABU6HIX5_9RHOB|nr:GNAT family protein [Mesobacterium sp. TK19101]MEC3862414.1 GNAT family protein [Mesobacterium sp. TK19101]